MKELRIATTIGGGLLALLAVAVFASGCFDESARENARQFNGDIWRNGTPTSEDPYSPRLRMVDAAIAQLSPGMNRDEIIAVLGLPDREDESTMTWELGVRVIDYDSLVVYLDGSGRMTRAAYVPG